MSVEYGRPDEEGFAGGIGGETSTAYAEPVSDIEVGAIGDGAGSVAPYAETNAVRKAANVPRDVQPPSKEVEEAASKTEEEVEVGEETDFSLDSVSSIVTGSLSNLLGEWRKSNSDEAQAAYAQDLSEWKRTGKGYFDPNVDVTPELNMFMEQVPSKVEALEGELAIGDMAESDNVFGWIANPAANIAAEAGMDEGKASYVGEQTWMDAINGYIEGSQSGGFIGGAVQAVLDGVLGYFSHSANYDEAVAADKKRMEQVRKRYELAMKRWLLKRWDKNQQSATRARKQMARALTHEKKEKERKKEKKKNESIVARQRALKTIASIYEADQRGREKRAGRWGR